MRNSSLRPLLLGLLLVTLCFSVSQADIKRNIVTDVARSIVSSVVKAADDADAYLLSALGFTSTAAPQTLSAPDPVLALDFEGTLVDFGGAVNSGGGAVAAVPGSRLTADVVYDTDSSGNPLHPSTLAGSIKDYTFYKARENNESITSEDFRTTDAAGSGEHYYQNQTLASPATTSLTTPLRDFEGRYYEERVKNGGFDIDAEWTATDTTIAAGVASVSTSSVTQVLNQTTPAPVVGNHFILSFAISNYSGPGSIRMDYGGEDTEYQNTNGIHTATITASSAVASIILRAAGGAISCDIDDINIIGVDADGNLTNVLDGGVRTSTTNYLLNSDVPATQTTGSLTTGWYSVLTWNNTGSVAVTAGTATIANLTGAASDGTPAYFEVTVAGTVTVTETGTVDYFQLQGGIVTAEQTMFVLTAGSTVTQTANVDESVLLNYEGLYTLSGQRIEGSGTNYLLNSETPATQTTGSLVVGDYVLWMDGTGSADLTAGTATISTTGSATDGSPLTFSVTVEGTVTVTVAGTEDRIQLEGGNFPTSIIQTAGSTVTRSAVNLTVPTSETGLTAAEGAGRLIVTPLASGQTGKVLSSYTDADNQLSVDVAPTTITLNKEIATTTHTASKSYTHAANEQVIIDWSYGAAGMSVNAFVVGATAGAAGTDADTNDAVLGSTIQIGAANNVNHLNATFDSTKSFKNAAEAARQLDDWSL